ncbi:MAG: esterase family protein [Candidatus Krumholzibacteria bacterium]|nr:esterase family protein [Candidatus Krumholzibacteria bacterium]
MRKKKRLLMGRIDTFLFDSRVLRDNALGDPHRRVVTVYLPPEYDKYPNRRFPVFVDAVGFLGAGPAHVNWMSFNENVPLRLERLVRQGKMGPVIAVFPDCWTRLGGNQYINSSAVGDYADYILKEILPETDRRYRTFKNPRKRAIFGKSSGGYGAIVHGMRYARHWGAIACHSGDMYFDFCYRPDIPKVLNTLAKHGRKPERYLRAFYAKKKMETDDPAVIMFLAMAAFYDPDPRTPLGFHLPMDLYTGEFDDRRWARWLRHDPIHMIKKTSAKKQLLTLRGIYMDCGTKDQWHMHYGARILHERLKTLDIRHCYEEFDDNHSSIDYRMDVSLPWLYRCIMG